MDSLREQLIRSFSSMRNTGNPVMNLSLIMLAYLGLQAGAELEKKIMDMKKEIVVNGYKFTIGVRSSVDYLACLLSWAGLKSFEAEELRKYRYALLQVQNEIAKMQADIDRNLYDKIAD